MKIAEYLKYYIGQDVETESGKGPLICVGDHERGEDCIVTIQNTDEESGFYGEWEDATFTHEAIKPILRKLEDITYEDAQEVGYDNAYSFLVDNNSYVNCVGPFLPRSFNYLVSQGYDIFGLIPAGLAIDAKTLNTPNND